MSLLSSWTTQRHQDRLRIILGEQRDVTLEILKQTRTSWTSTHLLVLLVLLCFISLKAYFILWMFLSLASVQMEICAHILGPSKCKNYGDVLP